MAEAYGDIPGAMLFPAEEGALARAVAKRRREFTNSWALVNTIDAATWSGVVRTAGISVAGVTPPSPDELRRSFGITSLIELAVDADAYQRLFGTALVEDLPFLLELLGLGVLHADGGRLVIEQEAAVFADDVGSEFSSTQQGQLFAWHLQMGRSKVASQYFPVVEQGAGRG